MIPIQVVEDAVLLPVKAQPGARRNGIVGEHGGRLKVAVTQVAEKGKANGAICELVAESLGIAGGWVSVASGLTASLKVLRIEGVTADRVEEWLTQNLSGSERGA